MLIDRFAKMRKLNMRLDYRHVTDFSEPEFLIISSIFAMYFIGHNQITQCFNGGRIVTWSLFSDKRFIGGMQ
jgi:hypothetical protein